MIEGGCLCRAVRWRASAPPIVTRACWCRLCQYLATGNAAINLAFPSDALTVTGELRDYPSIADSGSHMHRRFCPVCGTHLFSAAEERPHLVFVRAGTLDDPSVTSGPQAVIWTSQAPAWAHLDPHILHYEGQAPPAA